MKILFVSSENENLFGVSKIINQLKKKISIQKINILVTNHFLKLLRFNPDMIHIHGCWHPRLILFFIYAKIKKKKIIISPHGMIDPYSFSQKKFKKIIAWFLYQRKIITNSDLIIVNSNLEKLNLKKKINHRLNIKVIHHGINILNRSISFKKNKRLKFVFFSRIHPLKNLHGLLEIWSNSYFDIFDLYVHGYITNKIYFNKLTKFFRRRNIFFKGAINHNIQKKLSKYDFLIHPSHSENFGLVILEGLSSGLFIIYNNKLDWNILEKNNMGIGTKIDLKNLKKKINSLLYSKYLLSNKYRRKRISFVKREFDWKKISQKYMTEYKYLI